MSLDKHERPIFAVKEEQKAKPDYQYSSKETPSYDRDCLPDGPFYRFRKTVPIFAIRIQGPFIVATSEGPLSCEDGFLALDARGYPYPIAADEFALIYEPAGGLG